MPGLRTISKAVLALAIFLAACDSQEATPKKAAVDAVPLEKAQPAPAAPAMDEAELAKADSLVQFANRARQSLDAGYYSLADKLAANTQVYLHTYSLPKRPVAPGRSPALFKAEKGMFDEQEEADLARAYNGMDKALTAILGHYANLEKYVADRSIRDDGKLGRQLADKIAGEHASFLAARKSWLAIVDRRAAQAEDMFIAAHPLARQIRAARDIFTQFAEITVLLSQAEPQRELLAACRDNLRELAGLAGRPPFPARPALERLYRQFLKEVARYIDIMDTGVSSGFYRRQRQELNVAQLRCQKSYNEFVTAANIRQR